jgi:D-3-phosphoglycerate dehydrogenase
MNTKTSFPKDKIRILLLEGIHTNAVDVFQKAGYTNVERLTGALPSDELAEKIKDVHMVGVRSRSQIKGGVLDAAEKLMSIGCFCIGTNQVDLETARTRGVPVFNAPHSNTRSVAELVIAETVMLYRGIGDKSNQAHEGVWTKSALGSHEVRGKTIGIVGYGHIGSQVSILAEAFGMRVLYHDVEPKLAMGNAQQVGSLEELLGAVDVLTLHVPQTPETADLMTHERIRAMKKGSLLLNLSRGNVVDIQALRAALDDEHLLGAAVDVFPTEPKSNNDPFVSPLCGARNTVLTPHIGGSTGEAQFNIGTEVATKLVNYSDLGATIGAVNFPQISLSAHAGAQRLLHVHANKPGVLQSINKVFAESDVNIIGQHLQTLPDIGYVVTEVGPNYSSDLVPKLTNVEGTIRCRVLY